MMRALAFLVLLLCTACTLQHVPPDSAPNPRVRVADRDIAWIMDTVPIVRFNPPYVYAVIRMQAEQCSGLTREGWPRLYVAPINPIPTSMGPAKAIYTSGANAIVFALGYETDPRVVLHELLHYLRGEAKRQHRDAEFGPDSPCARLLNAGA